MYSQNSVSLFYVQGSNKIEPSGVMPKSYISLIFPVGHPNSNFPEPIVVSLHIGPAKPRLPKLSLWISPDASSFPNSNVEYRYMKGDSIAMMVDIMSMSHRCMSMNDKIPYPKLNSLQWAALASLIWSLIRVHDLSDHYNVPGKIASSACTGLSYISRSLGCCWLRWQQKQHTAFGILRMGNMSCIFVPS